MQIRKDYLTLVLFHLHRLGCNQTVSQGSRESGKFSRKDRKPDKNDEIRPGTESLFEESQPNNRYGGSSYDDKRIPDKRKRKVHLMI